MAGTVVKVVATATSTTSNTTLAGTVSAVPAVGSHLTLSGRTATAVTVSSIADTINTWNIRANGTGSQQFIADCIVAGDMTGATITVTLSANDANKIFWVHEWAGLHATSWFGAISPNAVVLFNGTARNIQGNKLTPSGPGDVVIGWYSDASAETSLAASVGYTNLPGVTGSGYYNGTSSFSEGVYQTVAAVNPKEPLATGGASPTGYAATSIWYRSAAGAQIPPRAEMRFVHVRKRN